MVRMFGKRRRTHRRVSTGQAAIIAAITMLGTISAAGVPAFGAPPAGTTDQEWSNLRTLTPATPDQSPDLEPMSVDQGATPQQDAAMQTAAKRAGSTGKPVVVDSLTTETQQIAAQPGGGFTLVDNPQPVRTKRHGAWVPIDTTLHATASGLTPNATAYGTVVFSDGGTGPLVTTSSGTTSYSLTWPTALPKPTVSGSTATYPNVLPGVDLVVAATDTGGFSDVLVVKNAQAGKNPRLKSLSLASKVTGGTRTTSAALDGLTVTGAENGNVLDASTPLIWDSNTAVPSAGAKKPAAGGTTPDASDAAHPGAAAHVSVVQARNTGGKLTLAPDAGMLSSASTVYPVYIDPTANWHIPTVKAPAFDEVKQGSPCNSVSLYNNKGSAGDDGNLGVGDSKGWGGGCEGIMRAYYQWALPSVTFHSDIQSATVNVQKVYSAKCGASSTVDLHWTGGIGSGTDWNNKPGYLNGYRVEHTIGQAYNGNCPVADPDPVGYDVSTPIRQNTGSSVGGFTAALAEDAAEASGSNSGFSRFSDNPSLEIRFNRAPNTPTAANLYAVAGSADVGCATAAPYPYMGKTIQSNTPVLKAYISDPDGDHVQANYKYWLDGSSTVHTGSSQDNLASGATASLSLDSTFVGGLTNGQVVDWQVQVYDGMNSSGMSPVCHFTAEPTAPNQPGVNTADGHYPDIDAAPGPTLPLGQPAGTPGVFTLSGATDGAPATKFLYNLDTPPATSGTPANEITPVTGTAASSPADRWTLTDGTGTTAGDSAGTYPATLGSGATWATDSTRGTVLNFNGTSTGTATTSGPVLNTTGSYSVSAWVNMTNTNTYNTIISQQGTNASAFYLQYSAAYGAWTFTSPSSDSTSPASYPHVSASAPPTLNTWTQLVGVYDADAKTMSLYINGALVGTASNTSAWSATGPLNIGHAGAGNYFPGKISDVQAYSRALTATEVNSMYAAANITLTPQVPGPHTLYVQAQDAAGDVSGARAYHFEAASDPNTTCATLADCFNNTAISANTNMSDGAADGHDSYSATDLTNAGWKSGGTVTINGGTFTLPNYGHTAGNNSKCATCDNVLAANQTITYNYPVPTDGLSALQFLAFSTAANAANAGQIQSDTTAPYVPAGIGVTASHCFDSDNVSSDCPAEGTIHYVGGATSNYFLTVPDWISGPPSLAAVTLPHWNNPAGQDATKQPKIFPFSIPLTPGLTVSSITLPDVGTQATAPALHILAMTTRNTTTTGTDGRPTWTGAWASPTELNGNFLGTGVNYSNQTFRIAVNPSISGDTLRVKLDNALGTSPLNIGHATVALDSGTTAATPSGAFTNLTFGGSTNTTIPEGGMVFSDPLPYTVTANQWLLVSFTLTNTVPYLVEHSWASDTDHTYVSAPGSGDHTTDTTATAFTGTGTHSGTFTDLLTDLDVTTNHIPTQAVLGDGLIDAWQPNTAPNGETGLRISDDLAAAEPTTTSPYGTIAEGIESNYLMKDNPQTVGGKALGGPSALSRIDRDILDQPGVNTVVLDEGLDDILNGATSDDLTNNGYDTLIGYFQNNTINTIAMGLHACYPYAGDGATGNSTNDPCTTTTVEDNRTNVNSYFAQGPLDLGTFSTPGFFYIDPDQAIGVPGTNGIESLDPNAAIPTDHVNLTNPGYGALTNAYLGPQDTWAFDDGATDPTTTTAEDSATNGDNPFLVNNPDVGAHNAQLDGGYTWANDSTHGNAITFNGSTGYAATDGPALDTSRSFSISVWVKMTSLPNDGNNYTIAAQDSTNVSAFYLQYNTAFGDQPGWNFSLSPTESGTDFQNTFVPGATTNWTHLVGVYNAASQTSQLYVNGTLAADLTGVTTINATGPFTIGRGLYDGAPTDFLPGTISNLQAWNYALSAPQVSALYQQIS